MAISFDQYMQSWKDRIAQEQFLAGQLQEGGAGATSVADPIAELRRRFGVGSDVSDQQMIDYFKANGLPDPIEQSTLEGLVEMATPFAVMGAAAFGGNALFGAPSGAAGTAGATLGNMAAPATLAEEIAMLGGGPAITSAGTAAGGAAGGAAAAGGLGSLLADGRTTAQILGALAPAALGAYGASKQADAYGALADKYMGMGAPYRDRLAALYANPSSFLMSPEVQNSVQMGTDALARALSVQGNPAGSGTALQTMQNYAANTLFSRLGEEKDRLAGFGGLSAYNQAAPGAAGAEIGAGQGIYDAIGGGMADILNPPKTLDQIAKELKNAGMNLKFSLV